MRDLDQEAEREGMAIKGGFRMIRHNRSKAPASRQSISKDYRVSENKVNRLSMLNVINGRAS